MGCAKIYKEGGNPLVKYADTPEVATAWAEGYIQAKKDIFPGNVYYYVLEGFKCEEE